jgi:hypothetical protein
MLNVRRSRYSERSEAWNSSCPRAPKLYLSIPPHAVNPYQNPLLSLHAGQEASARTPSILGNYTQRSLQNRPCRCNASDIFGLRAHHCSTNVLTPSGLGSQIRSRAVVASRKRSDQRARCWLGSGGSGYATPGPGAFSWRVNSRTTSCGCEE